MNEVYEIALAMLAGGGLGWGFWRLVTGRWIPDGSWAASHAPSAVNWKKVEQILDANGDLYEHRNEIMK